MSSPWIRLQESAVVATAASVVAIATFLPLAYLAWEALATSSGALMGLASGIPWMLLSQTLARALLVTLLAVTLGLPLGFLLGRTNVVGRRWLLALHVFPMFLPPFLLALGWFYLLGRQGTIGSETSSRLLFGELGVVLVQTLAFSPVVTAMVMLGLGGVDPALEEAGRTVASPWRVATRISLPLIRPSLALAGLVVFALALAEMGVPMFLRVRAYPAVVFARLGGIAYSPGEAFVLATPLVAIAMLVLALERRIARRPIAMTRLRSELPPVPLGRARLFVSLACWAAACLSSLPILGLLVRAIRGDGLAQVPAWIGNSLSSSLIDAATGATVITSLGAVLGWALARGRKLGRAVDGLMALAFVTPAAVLGVGLIAAWNRPSTGFFYTSAAIVVVGYVARYAVIGARPIAAAIVQTSLTVEEAASALGAGFLRRFCRIVLPIHKRAIGWAWLLALVFCLRDLETAVLYYPPGGETLPIRIFTLEANAPEAVVAALALVHIALTGGVLGAGAVLLRRRP